MKRTLSLCAGIFLALCATGCSKKAEVYTKVPENPGVFMKKLNVSDSFIRGVDVSTVIAQEKSGVVYKDADGNPQDIFKTLRDNGVNYIRVRLWNNPFDDNGKGFGGGNNDLDTLIEIGKRASKEGLPLLVDFHYSDFWADPAKQQPPRAWKNFDVNKKCDAIYDFTKSSLKKIRAAGISVGMVQIGNETTGFMCGEKNWTSICKMMNAGSKAVREVSKDIKVVLHFANPEKEGEYLRYAQILKHNKVDYDVFASSWYPYWHGTKDNLTKVLKQVADFSEKEILLAEFSWAYTYDNGDDSGNSVSEESAIDKPYSISVQGQVDCIADAMDAVASLGDVGLGVFWWEPAWIPVPGKDFSERQILWEKYGSGWASSYAAVYDPDDAGVYYGGSAWDNQALFDFDGKPLASLAAFGLAGVGAVTEVKADTAEEQVIRVRLGDRLELPETVKVRNNDGSYAEVPVKWNSTATSGVPVEEISMHGVEDYRIYGTADGVKVLAKVSSVEKNYAENWSFEDKDLSMWTINNTGNCKECFVQEKKTDAKTGDKALHFWSDDKVSFEVEQKITGLVPGKYKLSLQAHGGDAKNQDMKLFAVSNGREYVQQFEVDGWRNFRNPVIEHIEVKDGTVIIGAKIVCDAGGWGSLDDFILAPEE